MIKRASKTVAVIVTTAVALTLSGCQTSGGVRDQVAGAGIGAALGCGVGALITRNGRGCAAGAAIGGALGWAVVAINQYESKQVRTSSNDRRVYGLAKPVSSTQVKIRDSANSPTSVKRGDAVEFTTDYSLLLPEEKSYEQVTESWALKQNGKTVASLPSKTNKREDGGWEATAEITVPKDIPPGTYQVEHKVQAGSSYDTETSEFVVRA